MRRKRQLGSVKADKNKLRLLECRLEVHLPRWQRGAMDKMRELEQVYQTIERVKKLVLQNLRRGQALAIAKPA